MAIGCVVSQGLILTSLSCILLLIASIEFRGIEMGSSRAGALDEKIFLRERRYRHLWKEAEDQPQCFLN